MANFRMWSYWRDKRGIAEAIECDYNGELDDHPLIAQSLHQIKINEHFIDSYMTRLEEQDWGNEEE